MAKNAAGISTVELPECEDAGANECVIDDEEGEEEHIDDDEEYSVGSFVSDDSETHERWPSCDECGKGGVETWPVQENGSAWTVSTGRGSSNPLLSQANTASHNLNQRRNPKRT